MNTGNEQYRVSRSVSASLAGRALKMCKKYGSLSTTPARGSAYAAKDEWSLQTGNQYCKFNGKTSRKTSTRWMSLPAGIESSQHRTRNQLTKNRLRVKLLISPQPRHEQKAIKRKHLRETADCMRDNHYGAGQQIACEVPCRYTHYGTIAKGTTKAAVISKVQVVGPKLHLTDSTINFLKKRNWWWRKVQIGTKVAETTVSRDKARVALI